MKKVIFVDRDGSTRSPMAVQIYSRYSAEVTRVLARGLFVSFGEPLNPKTEAILISDGSSLKGFVATKLDNNEIDEETIIYVMDKSLKEAVIEGYEAATTENTFILNEYIGQELDVMDPYGGNLQSYAICYETLKNMIKNLIENQEKEG